jgi:hypothetical protein
MVSARGSTPRMASPGMVALQGGAAGRAVVEAEVVVAGMAARRNQLCGSWGPRRYLSGGVAVPAGEHIDLVGV